MALLGASPRKEISTNADFLFSLVRAPLAGTAILLKCYWQMKSAAVVPHRIAFYRLTTLIVPGSTGKS